MKKIFFLISVALLAPATIVPRPAYAFDRCSVTTNPKTLYADRPAKFTVSGYKFNPTQDYSIYFVRGGNWYLLKLNARDSSMPLTPKVEGSDLTFSVGGEGNETSVGDKQIKITKANSESEEVCRIDYKVYPSYEGCRVDQTPKQPGVDQQVNFVFSNFSQLTDIAVARFGLFSEISPDKGQIISGGQKGDTYEATAGNFQSDGQYTIVVKARRTDDISAEVLCSREFSVGKTRGDQSTFTYKPGEESPPTSAFEPTWCDSSKTSLQTALGCIPIRDTNQFVGWFLKWALGIAGGVAFLLIIFAGFQIMSSTGNPDKIQGGKELLNAAISGLILIIFSVFLLKLIGVDILGLPGFG
ncbi:MAG: hypothetical protein A2782_03900 [Candidatus Blackburnbacteria bacterium RIFCSPHIGHO2_01_FULL_43_15b]|uniref:Ig-like domain-containing protein n=1 Tax=Candidatus Blackburnbacteria bacterium RIFCSPHIGHO2_01_FULL_43_15b TaxID=1797513 RepID=A0A1G1UYD3_9BACT|nr:MAG: hypothetical protein A2782_03900 [Candidatus Blackburnbacteria bacterium RIFCSPHIGHO2_01_FULL_43_15b]